MKKFRLFAMVAALAMMSTVFAAWSFITYQESYVSDAVSIKFAGIDKEVIGGEAISFSVASAQPLTVSYKQEESNSTVAKAMVNNDITVTVTEIEKGASEKYSYSFKVYRDTTGSILKNEDETTAKPVSLENGKLVITAEAIAEYLTWDLQRQPTKDLLLNMEAGMRNEYGNGDKVFVKVYAEKIDE